MGLKQPQELLIDRIQTAAKAINRWDKPQELLIDGTKTVIRAFNRWD